MPKGKYTLDLVFYILSLFNTACMACYGLLIYTFYFSNAMSTKTGGVSPVVSQTSIAIISGATNTNIRYSFRKC